MTKLLVTEGNYTARDSSNGNRLRDRRLTISNRDKSVRDIGRQRHETRRYCVASKIF